MIRKILLFCLFCDIKIVKFFCKSKAFLLIFSGKASVFLETCRYSFVLWESSTISNICFLAYFL